MQVDRQIKLANASDRVRERERASEWNNLNKKNKKEREMVNTCEGEIKKNGTTK